MSITGQRANVLHARRLLNPEPLTPAVNGSTVLVEGFYEKKIKVSREFDEFRVNTRLCKLRCWYL